MVVFEDINHSIAAAAARSYNLRIWQGKWEERTSHSTRYGFFYLFEYYFLPSTDVLGVTQSITKIVQIWHPFSNLRSLTIMGGQRTRNTFQTFGAVGLVKFWFYRTKKKTPFPVKWVFYVVFSDLIESFDWKQNFQCNLPKQLLPFLSHLPGYVFRSNKPHWLWAPAGSR